jgi:hypothetical protein
VQAAACLCWRAVLAPAQLGWRCRAASLAGTKQGAIDTLSWRDLTGWCLNPILQHNLAGFCGCGCEQLQRPEKRKQCLGQTNAAAHVLCVLLCCARGPHVLLCGACAVRGLCCTWGQRQSRQICASSCGLVRDCQKPVVLCSIAVPATDCFGDEYLLAGLVVHAARHPTAGVDGCRSGLNIWVGFGITQVSVDTSCTSEKKQHVHQQFRLKDACTTALARCIGCACLDNTQGHNTRAYVG